MHSDDLIDGIIMLLLLSLFIPFTLTHARPLYKGEFGGFAVQIEKTCLKTIGEIIPSKRSFTSHDTILLLAIADDYSPNPRVIEINGTSINIDTNFLTNRIKALQDAHTAMPVNCNMTLDLYVGPSGLRKWVIKNE